MSIKRNMVLEKAADGAARDLDKLLAEKKPQLPRGFSRELEQELCGSGSAAVGRRLALLFLEQPWPKMAKAVRNDRDYAVALAEGADLLANQLARYRELLGFLAIAHTRMTYAICVREDFDKVFAAARATTAKGNRPKRRREWQELVTRLAGSDQRKRAQLRAN